MNNNFIKIIQELDQTSSIMKSFANLVSAYFSDLIKNGFKREEALYMAKSYQYVVINHIFDINHDSKILENDFYNEDYQDNDDFDIV